MRAMGKTATTAQIARARTRQWRTALDAEKARQDERIQNALHAVLVNSAARDKASAELADAHAAHADAIRTAEASTSAAIRALKSEGLTVAEIAALTALAPGEVRRALKTSEPIKPGEPTPASTDPSTARVQLVADHQQAAG
jgi:DNA-directed RNA polymerase specialized sigma24 family protein